MSLVEGYAFPLCVLENMLNMDCVALEEVTRKLNTELDWFSIRNS